MATTFAERFIEALKVKNITAAELSRLSGASEGLISDYKKGVYEPKQRRLDAFARILNVSIPWLMGADVPMGHYDVHGGSAQSTRGKGVKIPVFGKIAPGIPIESIEEIIDYEEIHESMAKTGDFFGLQINGDSMGPRFLPGDVVIVRKQGDCQTGEIAVLMVNGENATVKKLKKRPEGLILISTNPQYEPMYYSNKEILSLPVVILGKVVELRAKF